MNKLDEADRGLFVEHLPADKVRNVLLLSLRKKHGAPVLQKQPLAHAPLALHQVVSAQEPVAASKKRGNPAASSDDSKRAKIWAALLQDLKKGAAQVVVKKEQDIIEIVSDAEELEAEANDQAEIKEARQPLDLPMYLRVRNESGHNTLKDFDDLPVLVQAELKRRFEEMWSFTKNRTHDYATCTLNPAKYMDRPWCIRNLVVRGSRGQGKMYSQGGELMKTADDRCMNARQPCAHFTKYKDQYIIRLVPLPGARRQGKNWTEIGYWVL